MLRDDLTTFDVLDRAAVADPDAVALVIDDRRVTFGGLQRMSELAAARLAERGLRPGDRVALLLKNSPEWAAAFYALGRLGAVAVPINPRFTNREVEYVLRQSGAVGMLAEDSAAAGRDYAGLARELLSDSESPLFWTRWQGDGPGEPLAELFSGSPLREAVRVTSHDLAIIQYTSGSTSAPKGAVLRHSALTGVGRGVAARMQLRLDDRLFTGMPFFHVGGTVLHLMLAHSAGIRAVGQAAYSAPGALRLISAEACTMFAGIETHFLRVLELPEFDPSMVRSLVKAIAPGSPATLRRIASAMELDVVAIYGLSETASNISMCSIWDPEPMRVETCGYAQDGCETGVFDPESGARLGVGRPGEIWVRGFTLMAGYHELDAATDAAFTEDGWLRTGDLGLIDDEDCLRFVGRLKDIIRVGGENVSAAEVEDVLYSLEPVAQAAVLPRQDTDLGEVPVAFVTLRPGVDADEFKAQLRNLLAGRISGFKQPREVIVLDEMPQTGSGKIHKPTLRELLGA